MKPVDVPLPPLRAESVPVALAAHLERLIVTGQLEVGARLPSERALAATLSVSRSTLREAMYELEAKRLIERTPGRGTTVLESSMTDRFDALTAQDTEQTYAAELRVTVEPPIAALAAQRATRANLLQMRSSLEQSHDGLTPDESLRLDVEFHQLVARASGNPLLASLQELAAGWVAGVRQQSHATPDSRRASRQGHEEILAAITAGDADGARLAMQKHLRVVAHLIATADPDDIATSRTASR